MSNGTQPPARLVETLIDRCRERKWSTKIADSMGAQLTGCELLARSLVLRRLLRRHVLAEGEQYIGVLLPPSVGGVVANTAIALDRRVSVNLNYTSSPAAINDCIRQSGVRHVLTSRRFLEKMDLRVDAEMVMLEDFRDRARWSDKAIGAAQAYAWPARLLCRSLGTGKTRNDDVLTVIFTSGSTGEAKGVMLTHGNIAHNVQGVREAIQLTSRDVLLGVLPFFHSFGYTVTLWAVLTIDVKGAYHFNPLDAKQVGKLCRENGGTLLLAAPTFLRTYARRCDPEDFRSLEVVVTGAEKLPNDISEAFESKFGIRPDEGYGTTELSPVVSVNLPARKTQSGIRQGAKVGTVGRPLREVQARIVDLDTGKVLGPGVPGMLQIKGPNVMKGYLGRDDLTAQVIKDGWYTTGDVATIDDEGFIRITGRESRFSKIGGEMVPHIKIEETLAQAVGMNDDGAPRVAVTAVPDERKGERLVVLHTRLDSSPEELCRILSSAGLPNLYIPSPESFIEVERVPILASGKLDLRRIKETAREKFDL